MDVIVWIVTTFFIIIGTVLAVVGLPGTFLVWLAMLLNSWYFDFNRVDGWCLALLFVIAILGYFIDNISMILGAKKLGTSNWGIVGSIAGSIVGFAIFNFIGMVVGAFIGAVLVELLQNKKEVASAAKKGLGAVIGIFIGILLRFAIVFLMIIIWSVLVIAR